MNSSFRGYKILIICLMATEFSIRMTLLTNRSNDVRPGPKTRLTVRLARAILLNYIDQYILRMRPRVCMHVNCKSTVSFCLHFRIQRQLAERYGNKPGASPFFVYSKRQLTENVDAYLSALKTTGVSHIVGYSVKVFLVFKELTVCHIKQVN
jgi:hypothetical protein